MRLTRPRLAQPFQSASNHPNAAQPHGQDEHVRITVGLDHLAKRAPAKKTTASKKAVSAKKGGKKTAPRKQA